MPCAEQDANDNQDGQENQAVLGAVFRRQGVGNAVGFLGEPLAAQRVDEQADRHAHRCSAEADVEAVACLQPAGDQRANEAAQVDAHVEDGEAGVAALVLLAIQAAHQGGGVRFQAAGANTYQHQACDQAWNARQEGQCDVARHDHDGRTEEDLFGAEETVGEPGAEDRRQVNATTVRAHQTSGEPLVNGKSALLGGEVHVVEQDSLHAVEGESLPHFHGEEAGQHLWVAEE